jgi:hypothetical protein
MNTLKNSGFFRKPASIFVLMGLAVFSCFLAGCAPTYPTPIPCGDTQALIEAIKIANTDPATLDIIELDANCIYKVDAVFDASAGNTGLPNITSPIRILGHGSTIIRVDNPGTDKFRLFYVAPAGDLTLSELTLENGYAYDPNNPTSPLPNSGGAVRNKGNLLLDLVTIQNNNANGVGGGIFNESYLVIKSSTIRWNDIDGNAYAMGAASAIHNRIGGNVIMTTSTVSENGVNGSWNAITNDENSSISIENSTISNNNGRAINNDGNLTLM